MYASGVGLVPFAKQAVESGILDRLGGCDALAEIFRSYDHDRDQVGSRLVAASVAGVQHPRGKAPPLPVRGNGVG